MDKSVWNAASLPGLALGGICIAYELVSWACGGITVPVWAGLAATVLWLLKFGGGLFLLYFFIKRYAASYKDVDNSDTFRFGIVASLYSSIFYAAFYFAYSAYIVPDLYSQAFDAILSSGAAQLDSSALEQLAELEPQMPAIGCIVKLVYGFVFGLILSAIFSRNIPSRNPFENNDNGNS